MIKRIVACFIVVIVGLATTGCATGGYLGPRPYQGPLGRVMAGNLAMTCPGDYFVGGINRCLGDLGGNMGRYMGYPMYYGGYGGPQLSENDKLSVFCGLGGAGVAMLAKAGLERVLGAGFVSAAACQAITTITASRRSGGQQPQVQTSQLQSSMWGPGVPFGGRGAFQQQCLEQGLITLDNLTGEVLKVFIEGKYDRPVAILQPRQQACVPIGDRYEAQTIQTVVSSDGWVGGTESAPMKPQRQPGLVLVWR